MNTDKLKRLRNIRSCMIQRCYNPNHTAARWYYSKGIRICDEWKNSFDSFAEWALSNGYDDDLTIDRIDPDGNYEPSNCRWVSRSENCRGARHCATSKIKAPKITSNKKQPKVKSDRYEVFKVDTLRKQYYFLESYSEWVRRCGVTVASFYYRSDAVLFRNEKDSEEKAAYTAKYPDSKHYWSRYKYEILKIK